jgi:hypothetical protein
MADLPGPQLLRLGRQRQQRIDLPFAEQPDRIRRRVHLHLHVFLPVEPDLLQDDRNEVMLYAAQRPDRERLPAQVAQRAHTVGHEQLVASRVDPGEHRDRQARVEAIDPPQAVGHADVCVAAPDRVFDVVRLDLHVLDIGETLGAEQILGDPLRRDADSRAARQPDACGFEITCGGGGGPRRDGYAAGSAGDDGSQQVTSAQARLRRPHRSSIALMIRAESREWLVRLASA